MAKHVGLPADFVDRLEQEWEKKHFKFSSLPLAICARVQRAAYYFETHIARLAEILCSDDQRVQSVKRFMARRSAIRT